jgi:O-antigen/teichoic acid export membrane protein
MPQREADTGAGRRGAGASFASAATRSFVTLGAGEMIARLIGFAATVYLARQLGVDAYGIVGFAFAVSLYLAMITDAGLEQHGPLEVAQAKPPLGTLISSVLAGRLLLALILGIGLAAASSFAPRPDSVVLALYGLTLLPAGLNARWVHYGLHNGAAVSRARIAAELLRFALILILVRDPGDLIYVPIAQFVGDGVAAGWLLVALRRNGVHLRVQLDTGMLRAVFRRASPLLANNLLSLAIYNADVIYLRFFHGTVEVGQYLAAYTMINFLGVLGNFATVSLIPGLGRLRDEPDERVRLFHTGLARVFMVGLPIAVGGTMLATRIITLVFSDAFAPAGPVLALLIWSIPMLLARSVYMAVLISEGRHDFVLRATAVAAALNLGLNLIAVPVFGMAGAAVTTLIAEGVRMLLGRRFAFGFGVRGAPPMRYGPAVIASGVIAAALWLVPGLPLALAVGGGALLYFAVLAILGVIGVEGGRLTLRV